MNANHITTAQSVTNSLMREPRPFAIRNARVVDARGVQEQGWVVTDGETIAATGTSSDELSSHAPALASMRVASSTPRAQPDPRVFDIHAHGGWGVAFDDGAEAISIARACHMTHGTTRQILSLITNPLDVMARNIRVVREAMDTRPDILGSHLEGPFLKTGAQRRAQPGLPVRSSAGIRAHTARRSRWVNEADHHRTRTGPWRGSHPHAPSLRRGARHRPL